MLEVEESKDYPLLKSIFTNNDVWWRIGGDDKPEEFEPPRECTYLLAKVDSVPAGIFVIEDIKNGTDTHIQLLPEFRHLKYELGAAILDKVGEYIDWWVTDIPKEHENVHHYALKNGYEVVDEDDDSWYYVKRAR